MNIRAASSKVYSDFRHRLSSDISTSAWITKFDVCHHVQGHNQCICFNVAIEFRRRIYCGHGYAVNEIIDSLKHNIANNYGVSAERVNLSTTELCEA
jgi:hypothetical protein